MLLPINWDSIHLSFSKDIYKDAKVSFEKLIQHFCKNFILVILYF